jgi:TRAP-type uncharacterized transport system substrate-binding protein
MPTLLRILAFLLAAALVVGGVGGALTVALRKLNLYPPESLTIAAGAPGSAYHDIALAYREVLARDEIALNIIETGGSLDNAAALAGDAGADIALVQGGVALAPGLEGLAAIQVEPLWVMARSDRPIDGDPNSWRGMRVATGGLGSGTRVVAEQLSGLTGATALHPDHSVAIGGAAAAAALLAGEVDIALFVAPPGASYLKTLIGAEDVRYVPLAHAEAIALRSSAARRVTMPSGIMDYQNSIPDRDLQLIALITRLVAREKLHPALVNRLMHAVFEVHAGGKLIPADRDYPSVADMNIKSNSYARQLLETGFSPLENLLPFWIVAQLNRILLVLVPAVLVLLPLLRLLPAVFQWIFRGRVFRHYARVNEIDQRVAAHSSELSSRERQALRRELDEIERRLRHASLPNTYRKQAYTLIHHIDYVRGRIDGTGVDPKAVATS